MKLFSVSSVSNRIENGEAAYNGGKAVSKRLLMSWLRLRAKRRRSNRKPISTAPESIGSSWAVAYYQWFSGRKFSDIFTVLV